MRKIIYRADARGFADYGGLQSYHTFPFNDYHNAERASFGALCVLNDDYFAPGRGVGFHPHANAEMVWLMLEGELTHRDDLGNETTLRTGEAQILSAGSGVWHSERNQSSHPARALQLWIQPRAHDTAPRYQKRTFEIARNRWQTIAAPTGSSEAESGRALGIEQDAFISLARIDTETTLKYEMGSINNGVYIFVIDGMVEVEGEALQRRDAIGLWGCVSAKIQAHLSAEILIAEVPH
jgi:redox-sensitive bicupin YhaK (pirin superfamily)